MSSLAEDLSRFVRAGELWERIDHRRIRCYACGHRCPIFEGQAGVCKVRFHKDGRLFVPWGYVAGVQSDPVEKKPFYHAWPGASALSFGMLGCDLHCGYCQNWVSSQTLRDPGAAARLRPVAAEELVEAAVRSGARLVVSTYNEPLITAEWAVHVFRLARQAGLATGFVSNGNATPEVLEYLRPWLDVYKVDLKSFRDVEYRKLGGRLAPVVDSIQRIHAMGFWLEVVTLLIPGLNDSDDEIRQLTGFLASVSADIPWHVTAFHADYKMQNLPGTTPESLMRAARIGRASGLRYVYAGNSPGHVSGWEDTHCPACARAVIRRRGFQVLENRLRDGRCLDCGAEIPGRWH